MERNSTHKTNRNELQLRSESRSANTASLDFVLQWGNRKRLRCMKVQAKESNNDLSGSGQGQRTTSRVNRRVVRSWDRNNNSGSKDPNSNQLNGKNNGYSNLRQSPASPSHRILRNPENSIGMRSNGIRGLSSPDRGDKKGGIIGTDNYSTRQNNSKNSNNKNTNHHNDNHHHQGDGGSGSSENGPDGKKGGSLSSSDTIATMWPPKFVIALSNKEKEEDFMVLKGSKLPQRPKKRAKFIQRALNLVSPGTWLCDLTLERYEVPEKKVTKKRPRGLKAMGNWVDSDSE